MDITIITKFMQLEISKYLMMATILLGIFMVIKKLIRG